MIRTFGFPIAAILLALTTTKSKDPWSLIIVKGIIVGCVVVFSVIISLVGGMCEWETYKTLFENKQNPTTKIVHRSSNCGAFDTTPYYKVCKIKEITPFFILATEIDTNQINKNEWIRIENKK